MKKFKIIWWRIKSVWAIYRFGHPSKKIKVIGVTGTNGKTTTATLLYQIATRLGFKAGLISTVENIIGDKKIGATHTTPDSVSLTRLLSEMVDMGCEYAFMEVSSHALDQNRVWGINFSGGIFSNLTHDHLDYHKTIENYFQAKKKFFKLLSQNAFALSNTDDEQGASMLLGIKARKFSYGFSGGENFHGQVKKIDYSGLQLIFNEQEINSQLLGKFNASNLLAVWSVCKLLDFDMQKVKNILKDIKPPRGRFEHFKSQNDVLIIVDYAHTPDALEKVFSAVNEIRQPDGRIISVFGCGGDRDPIKRPIMGKIGATYSDLAIFTSDNPRSENPAKIIEAMQADLSSELIQKVVAIENRREAIKKAVQEAQTGDIILCAGKGHEDYQEIKGVKHHFDDMEEFRKLFIK